MIRWWVVEFLMDVNLVGYSYRKTKGSPQGGMARDNKEVYLVIFSNAISHIF